MAAQRANHPIVDCREAMWVSFLTFFYHALYKFGPIALFFSLLLGIVGIPLPDELLLIGAGSLAAHQKINLFTTLLAAILGSICGITISYFLGRLVGNWLVKHYGARIHLTPERITRVKSWFSHIGKWLLIIGYFIPIFRHLFGFVAGGAKLNFKVFALFAYTGAIIWSIFFLSMGYFFNEWFTGLIKK
jgi:membrane protein DedA with SNARE-associated domain